MQIPVIALTGSRVLFISYNGMLDPLGQSQVLPYLRGLGRKGVSFTLLSFERGGAFEPAGRLRCEELQRELANENIEWHWLRYHQKPSLPATAFDVVAGIRLARKLVKRNRIQMVHARSHIPATIALALKKRFGLKMIFDIRGLMAEEYVDAEHWRRRSIPYQLTKILEREALAASDGVVTLTKIIWPFIKEWDGLRDRLVTHEIIPCCTDLRLYKFSDEQRARRRTELGLGDRFTIVYSGSIDGWYLTDKMVDFFAHVLRKQPSAYFLWLTPGRHERVRSLMRARGIADRDYTVLSASSQEVPSYLSASDAGLAFIKPCFSKLASSPTKYAEYLACGLPLIINAGIGDSDMLVERENVGVLLNDFSEDEYARSLVAIGEFTSKVEETRGRTRAVAKRLFDLQEVAIERYANLYENLLKGIN